MDSMKPLNKGIGLKRKMEQDAKCIYLNNFNNADIDVVIEVIDDSKTMVSNRCSSECGGQSTVLAAVSHVKSQDLGTKKCQKTKRVLNSRKKNRDPDWIPSQKVTKRRVTTDNNPPAGQSKILKLSTSTDPKYLQPSSSTDPKYLQPSTSTDPKYLQPSTSTDPKYLQPSTSTDPKYLLPCHRASSTDLGYQSSATSTDHSDTLTSSYERTNNSLSYKAVGGAFSPQYIRYICEEQKKYPEVDKILQPMWIFKKLKYLIQWKQNSPEDEIDGEVLDADIVRKLWPDLLAKYYVDLHSENLTSV